MKSKIYLFSLMLASCIIGSCNKKSQMETNIKIVTQKSSLSLASGTIERLDSFLSKFVTARNVEVWLPDGYSKSNKYAVLYMHDGQMLFDANTTWNKQEWAIDETAGKLIKNGETVPFIVVGAWNGGKTRFTDYFPQKAFETLSESFQDSLMFGISQMTEREFSETKIESDNYLSFLVEELKPYIDANYSTKSEAKSTFIAGSSMGGLISMYAISEYPEVFGGAACLSTHWVGTYSAENNPIPNAFMAYLEKSLPNPQNHKLYFDYGTATLDSLYEPFQLQADSILRLKGFDASNWKTLKFEGANHSENAWRERLHIPLVFLFSKE